MPHRDQMTASPAGWARGRRLGWWAAIGLVIVLAGAAKLAVPSPQAAPKGIQPEFRLTSIRGQHVSIPAGKPTLLYFMAAWCSSCWAGESALAPLWHREHGRALFVSLDVSPQMDSVGSLAKMAAMTGASWPQVFATPKLIDHYDVTSLDTIVVLSANGRRLYEGPTPGNAELARLLKAADPPHHRGSTTAASVRGTGPCC
jgi:hypothetical protein